MSSGPPARPPGAVHGERTSRAIPTLGGGRSDMIEKGKVREGEVVYSADGEKLGKVRTCEADVFIIEKGFFFPKDTIARYEDIADVSADGIHMLLGKEA